MTYFYLLLVLAAILCLDLYSSSLQNALNQSNKQTGETPLIRSCFIQNKCVVEYLINSKVCDLNKLDYQNKTALYISL